MPPRKRKILPAPLPVLPKIVDSNFDKFKINDRHLKPNSFKSDDDKAKLMNIIEGDILIPLLKKIRTDLFLIETVNTFIKNELSLRIAELKPEETIKMIKEYFNLKMYVIAAMNFTLFANYDKFERNQYVLDHFYVLYPADEDEQRFYSVDYLNNLCNFYEKNKMMSFSTKYLTTNLFYSQIQVYLVWLASEEKDLKVSWDSFLKNNQIKCNSVSNKISINIKNQIFREEDFMIPNDYYDFHPRIQTLEVDITEIANKIGVKQRYFDVNNSAINKNNSSNDKSKNNDNTNNTTKKNNNSIFESSSSSSITTNKKKSTLPVSESNNSKDYENDDKNNNNINNVFDIDIQQKVTYDNTNNDICLDKDPKDEDIIDTELFATLKTFLYDDEENSSSTLLATNNNKTISNSCLLDISNSSDLMDNGYTNEEIIDYFENETAILQTESESSSNMLIFDIIKNTYYKELNISSFDLMEENHNIIYRRAIENFLKIGIVVDQLHKTNVLNLKTATLVHIFNKLREIVDDSIKNNIQVDIYKSLLGIFKEQQALQKEAKNTIKLEKLRASIMEKTEYSDTTFLLDKNVIDADVIEKEKKIRRENLISLLEDERRLKENDCDNDIIEVSDEEEKKSKNKVKVKSEVQSMKRLFYLTGLIHQQTQNIVLSNENFTNSTNYKTNANAIIKEIKKQNQSRIALNFNKEKEPHNDQILGSIIETIFKYNHHYKDILQQVIDNSSRNVDTNKLINDNRSQFEKTFSLSVEKSLKQKRSLTNNKTNYKNTDSRHISKKKKHALTQHSTNKRKRKKEKDSSTEEDDEVESEKEKAVNKEAVKKQQIDEETVVNKDQTLEVKDQEVDKETVLDQQLPGKETVKVQQVDKDIDKEEITSKQQQVFDIEMVKEYWLYGKEDNISRLLAFKEIASCDFELEHFCDEVTFNTFLNTYLSSMYENKNNEQLPDKNITDKLVQMLDSFIQKNLYPNNKNQYQKWILKIKNSIENDAMDTRSDAVLLNNINNCEEQLKPSKIMINHMDQFAVNESYMPLAPPFNFFNYHCSMQDMFYKLSHNNVETLMENLMITAKTAVDENDKLIEDNFINGIYDKIFTISTNIDKNFGKQISDNLKIAKDQYFTDSNKHFKTFSVSIKSKLFPEKIEKMIHFTYDSLRNLDLLDLPNSYDSTIEQLMNILMQLFNLQPITDVEPPIDLNRLVIPLPCTILEKIMRTEYETAYQDILGWIGKNDMLQQSYHYVFPYILINSKKVTNNYSVILITVILKKNGFTFHQFFMDENEFVAKQSDEDYIPEVWYMGREIFDLNVVLVKMKSFLKFCAKQTRNNSFNFDDFKEQSSVADRRSLMVHSSFQSLLMAAITVEFLLRSKDTMYLLHHITRFVKKYKPVPSSSSEKRKKSNTTPFNNFMQFVKKYLLQYILYHAVDTKNN